MSELAPLWLFGDQLGRHFHGGEHADREVVLIESVSALGRHRYHRQKLHLVVSAMRRLAIELGDRATLIQAQSYQSGLAQFGRPVVVHEPGSHAAARLVETMRQSGRVTDILPTKGFALSKADFAEWVTDRRRFLMEDFYRDQRRRFTVLLEPDGEPVDGRWNLDSENRQPPPKRRTLEAPAPYRPREDDVDKDVRADLDRLVGDGTIDPVGIDGPRLFAVTQDEARRALTRFLDTRLSTFGPHQDAMLSEDWAMSHALISVPLNLGLLDPLEIIDQAEQRYRRGEAPLSSVEGFVRQVLGWREWVWHLYWHLGPEYLNHNALRATTALPDWWENLDPETVTAQCLRTAIAGLRDRGYAHHIQRLMVLGNHALQRGYDPRALTHWFATAFVDGFPWVMPANVIGMSQHADGGIVATKPYAAGGAYINRMSDHCRPCAYDPRSRLGERACPFTAGYWAFLDRNDERLAGNHRMVQPLRGLRRLDDLAAVVEQEQHRTTF